MAQSASFQLGLGGYMHQDISAGFRIPVVFNNSNPPIPINVAILNDTGYTCRTVLPADLVALQCPPLPMYPALVGLVPLNTADGVCYQTRIHIECKSGRQVGRLLHHGL
ncbi:hypothetical protein QBC33DRAFT_522303 [Phialemonium atrogriseum]|uniref:Uncharacterized protein n=1 Tax=Phialemonium atrogriseum TaxID=1093897 RepID=A0AAJ0C9N3_9PEZI|nr:uncharacterized protein QBC33DRAFT_522303 [Phialemonium atrogriseum]KAK1772719.1 hypothetical protein QBC33DRAFT_522303 [Phialemonium atrogriseum]